MNTINHDVEMPSAEAAPGSQNGHSADGVEGSRGVEVNAQLAQENAKLAQENAELVQERDLLRRVIDNLPDFIYAKDKQGRFVLNNLAHANDLGVKSPAEMKGKSDFDFFPPELAAQFYADEKKIIETGQPIINQEQYKCKPGDQIGQKILVGQHQSALARRRGQGSGNGGHYAGHHGTKADGSQAGLRTAIVPDVVGNHAGQHLFQGSRVPFCAGEPVEGGVNTAKRP